MDPCPGTMPRTSRRFDYNLRSRRLAAPPQPIGLRCCHQHVSFSPLPPRTSSVRPRPAVRWGQWGTASSRGRRRPGCHPHPTRSRPAAAGRSLAQASTWADEVRGERPATGPWHYVNIPIWQADYRSSYCPRDGCVIGTLQAQQKILRDRTRPRAEREEALKWVVHLIGDLHMPLHVGDGATAEERCQAGVSRPPDQPARALDSGLLRQRAERGGTGEHPCAHIARRATSGDCAGSVVDWAMESHATRATWRILPALDARRRRRVRRGGGAGHRGPPAASTACARRDARRRARDNVTTGGCSLRRVGLSLASSAGGIDPGVPVLIH